MAEFSRRQFLDGLAVLGVAAVVADFSATPAAAQTGAAAAPAGVPTLESMGSDWLACAHIAKRPEISNFWGGVGADANIAGVELLALVPYTQGGTACDVSFGGVGVAPSHVRWTAYDITRLGETPTGLLVRTVTRLAFEANQLLLQITVSNPTAASVSTTMSMALNPRIRKFTTGWDWHVPRPNDQNFAAQTSGQNVFVADTTGPAVSAFAFSPAPQITVSGPAGTAQWSLTVPAGGSKTINVVLAFGETTTGKALVSASEASTVLAAANSANTSFSSVFDAAASKWVGRWNDAFTPGNGHYSGALPVLSTNSRGINRLYYMSVLSVLSAERSNLGPAFNTVLNRTGTYSGFDRIYTTGAGLYGETTVFFWDTSYASVLLTLLDPAMIKAQTSYWLSIDIHRCYGMDTLSGSAVGVWYSANDLTVSSTILNYVKLTGDWAHLSSTAGTRTVLQALKTNATYWQNLVPSGQKLADYGGNRNLFEVLPKYTNQVLSFNAANVWLMRQVADLHRRSGDTVTATTLTTSATNLVPEVLALYAPGEGVWNCRYPDGTTQQVRTVVDFVIGANALAPDLTATQRTEMKAFVNDELLDGDWMRALSLSDSQAPVSRCDHGSTGAYESWPALTAQTFAKFGDYPALRTQLERFSGVTRQGPFGQAHQILPGVFGFPVADRPTFNPTGAITVAAWVNATSWDTNIWQNSIVSKDAISANSGYVLRGGAGGRLSFVVYLAAGGYAELQTTSTVPTGWHHVAATYDGSTMRIYVDGVSVASRAQTGAIKPSTGTDLVIGNCPSATTRMFRGQIAGAQVYTRALSTTEVSGQASAGNPHTNTDTALVLRVPRQVGPASVVPDSPALNPTGALTLSAWVNASGWATDIWRNSVIAKDTFGTSGNAGYVLRGGAGGLLSFVIAVGGNWAELRTTTALTAGRHHIAATYDGSIMRIYVDGVSVASRAQTGALTPSTGVDVLVGNCPRDMTRQFLGTIDNARVYTRALTSTEVSALRSAPDPFATADPALAVWCPAVRGPFTPTANRGVPAGDGSVFNGTEGGAFGGVIITDLFGYAPDGKNVGLTDAGVSRGITGTLSGITFNGVKHTITSGTSGLTIN